MMNVFLKEDIAQSYDAFYLTQLGREIDLIEKEAIGSYLRQISPSPILELGCGTGHWSEYLTTLGYEVVGTDISDAMLAIALQKQLPRVTFSKADALALPFADASFETVFTITMLEFTTDPQRVLAEIFRVLKPNGRLIVGCLNANSELGKTKDCDETYRLAHFFTPDELKNLLSNYGQVEIKACAFLSPEFELLDNTPAQKNVEGAFLAASVEKHPVNK